MNLYDEAIKAHQRGDDELARLLYVNAEMNAIADGDDEIWRRQIEDAGALSRYEHDAAWGVI